MLDDGAKSQLASTRFRYVRWFPEIDSTNRYLLDEARSGAPEGTVAVANHQTAGRGRLGREWRDSPDESLLVSILLRPRTLAPNQLHLATVAVSLAAARACNDVARFTPGLKWPNDLVVDDRKLAGVLSEVVFDGDRVAAVVVGIGINVNWPPTVPVDVAGEAIAVNHIVGHKVDRKRILVRMLQVLDELYGDWLRVAKDYRERCVTLGRWVRVQLPDETFIGTAKALTDEGHLLVDVGAKVREVAAGDVVHLRPVNR